MLIMRGSDDIENEKLLPEKDRVPFAAGSDLGCFQGPKARQ